MWNLFVNLINFHYGLMFTIFLVIGAFVGFFIIDQEEFDGENFAIIAVASTVAAWIWPFTIVVGGLIVFLFGVYTLAFLTKQKMQDMAEEQGRLEREEQRREQDEEDDNE